MIKKVLDEEERGTKSDEEEGATRSEEMNK